MAFSKVVLNGTTLMDVTGTTAEEADVIYSKIFTKANGVQVSGTMVLDDESSEEYVRTLTSEDNHTLLTEGYYKVPQGYNVRIDSLFPSSPILVQNWDLTSSLIDTINGSAITLSGATRDENGVTLSSTTDYAILPTYYREYHTYEFDIGNMNMGTLDTHGRLIMPTNNEGLIYRSKTNWNCYFNGGWCSTGDADSAIMANHTLTMVVEDSFPRFYIDGELWYTANRVQSFASSSKIMLGSNSGQSYYNVTFTGVRIYEGVKYS